MEKSFITAITFGLREFSTFTIIAFGIISTSKKPQLFSLETNIATTKGKHSPCF
jgi:hypothetical protein